MAKKQIGHDSLFRLTSKDAASTKPTVKATVTDGKEEVIPTPAYFSKAELKWLDDRARVLKDAGWRGASRAGYLRALVQADIQRKIELDGVTSQEELEARLAK